MIFLRVSWYPVHICANSVFKNSLQIILIWVCPLFPAGTLTVTLTGTTLQRLVSQKHLMMTSSLYFSLLPKRILLNSWRILGIHSLSLSLFFLSTNSKASKPSFHRILELFKHRTTLSIILKISIEAHQGPAISLPLEMAHLDQGWSLHKVSVLDGSEFRNLASGYNLSEPG